MKFLNRNYFKSFVIFIILITFQLTGTSIVWGRTAAEVYSGCDDNRFLSPHEPAMEGFDVLEIQQRLMKLGYQIKPDGVYGLQTIKEIKKFQKSRGIKADGVIGPITFAELGKSAEIMVQSPIPPPQGNIRIVIDTVYKTLSVYSDEKIYKTFPVAVGKSETPSPVGEFKVISKRKNWGTGFGSRWMGLNVGWGKYGIHGTNKPWSIGYKTSHGCFRMHNRHVEELFEWVKVGTPVTVKGNILSPFYEDRPILRKTERGSLILLVQQQLKKLGYYKGELDGIFGQGMAESVKAFQKSRGLKPTGEVDIDTWAALEF